MIIAIPPPLTPPDSPSENTPQLIVSTESANVSAPPVSQSTEQHVSKASAFEQNRAHSESPSTSSQSQPPFTGKRKLDDADITDPHGKIRRILRDHVSRDISRGIHMTTVICLHAAVAQKSYGQEKRFLCPPPIVHVDGPVWQMRAQQFTMAIIPESGERAFEQKAPLDNNMTSSFKFLHVAGTAKAKSFHLSLDILDPPSRAISSTGGDAPRSRIWASFDSAPVTIISKPSKKTAKTRNISSCILAGGPVSLFNRINSQTVRTKYMTIDHAQLCASNVAWSAFNVNVTRRPAEAPPMGGPQPVTYGCEIVLSDTRSGISTSPLVIRKVDKGTVSAEDGGPVSQMQKIALQRVNADGSRHYLSAAGPISPSTGVILQSSTSAATPPAGTHPLLFQSPRVRDEMKNGVRVICDEVDDYLCWTIVGISKFQYTFFDAFGQNDSVPDVPITPFPTLFSAPSYSPTDNTIELHVLNFLYQNPTTGVQTPLDVYLGPLGPLQHRVYQAPTPGTGFSNRDGTSAQTSDSTGFTPPEPSQIQNVVVVDMPSLAEVIKALEDDTLEGAKETAPASNNDQQVPSITGRSLPLLFIRASDGVGYHSGRTIACESVYQGVNLGAISDPSEGNIDTGWLAAAQASPAADGLNGWTLRVM